MQARLDRLEEHLQAHDLQVENAWVLSGSLQSLQRHLSHFNRRLEQDFHGSPSSGFAVLTQIEIQLFRLCPRFHRCCLDSYSEVDVAGAANRISIMYGYVFPYLRYPPFKTKQTRSQFCRHSGTPFTCAASIPASVLETLSSIDDSTITA